MKKLFCLLLLSSNLLLAQSNIAFLHVENPVFDSSGAYLDEFSSSSFELASGLVIVKAAINGQVGDFILDTGSPGIVLNSHKDEIQNSCAAAGVGGQMTIGTVEVKSFEWGIIRKEKTQGFVLDVSHLEVACGREIMGLIGFDVLKNYELFFDYKNKTVKVFNAGEVESLTNLKVVKSIPFTLMGHVPVISAKVGGKRAYLGLDSGAEVNLLDSRFFDKIDLKSLTDIEQEFLTGLDNQKHPVMAADIETTQVRRHCLPEMRYVFTDLNTLSAQFGSPLDGLLGFPFFKNQVISINYKNRKIYLWDN